MNHPAHCTACRGTGWAPGPTLTQHANGHPITYTTVTECRHDHWNDDPTPPHTLDRNHPTAAAALAQGLAQGLAERDASLPTRTLPT